MMLLRSTLLKFEMHKQTTVNDIISTDFHHHFKRAKRMTREDTVNPVANGNKPKILLSNCIGLHASINKLYLIIVLHHFQVQAK